MNSQARRSIKYLPEFDVNVFEAVVKHSKIFNLIIYREILIKKFTAHFECRNADLNLTLVAGTTTGFIFQIIKSLMES